MIFDKHINTNKKWRKTMNKKLTKVLAMPTLMAVVLTSTIFGFRPILHTQMVSIPDMLVGNKSIGIAGGPAVRNETASGLNTTTFDTLVGTVTVNLPDDLAA